MRVIYISTLHVVKFKIFRSAFKDYVIFTTYSPRYVAVDTTQSWGFVWFLDATLDLSSTIRR